MSHALMRALPNLLAISCILLSAALHAETKQDVRLKTAAYVLEEFQSMPEGGIPAALLSDAAAIVIVPNILKFGFVLGARFGRGVLVLRKTDGQWAAPAFVSLSSGSIGWQAGAQASDLVFVFRDSSELANIEAAKFTLGADASVAVGPVGRYTSAASDVRFDAKVYSYSRTRGLFAGVALQGAVLSVDKKDNARYYREAAISLAAINDLGSESVPASALPLLAALKPYASTADSPPGSDSPGAESDQAPAVRTFGLGDEAAEEPAVSPPEAEPER